jgi:hypothetical protein
MSLQVRVKVNEYTDGTEIQSPDDYFLRRDYTLITETSVSLTAGVRTPVQTQLTDINIIYLVVTGSATTVNLYKGNSPEYYIFSDMILMVGVTSVTEISLQATADTTVRVFIAGS